MFIKFVTYFTISFCFLLDIASSTAKDKNLVLEKRKEILLNVYGKNDLAQKEAFQGGFINFGYWKNIELTEKSITNSQRILASEALYKLVFEFLKPRAEEKILEVGSGKGYGCISLAQTYEISKISCVDMNPVQIQRAKKLHSKILSENKKIEFLTAEADNIPKLNESYDAIYSVEAAQYFPDMDKFAQEALRLLKPGGKLVIAAHFATNENGYKELQDSLPTVREGIDLLIPISSVEEAFTKNNFKKVSIQSIGRNVFIGFDKWLSQVSDVSWGRKILPLYQKGYLDYYLLVFMKT